MTPLGNRGKSRIHRLLTVGFVSRFLSLLTSLAITIIMSITIISTPSGKVFALATPKKKYRYFGYGSNVIPSTMKALRQIEVRDVTAAVLPDYELTFASAAFVRPVDVPNSTATDNNVEGKHDDIDKNRKLPYSGKVVHGLLYTLTEDEFAKVGQTEGVPFGYRWQSCLVYPYRGDGNQAGMDCLNDPDALPFEAYTLVEPTPASRGYTPPSTSYLGLIREGARLWKFDGTYQDKLATIRTASSNNLLFPDGLEGPALQLAEKATGTKRTYMIDGY